jgi:hypothetical protein
MFYVLVAAPFRVRCLDFILGVCGFGVLGLFFAYILNLLPEIIKSPIKIMELMYENK